MKQLYILAAGLLMLAACAKDDSTGAIHPLPAVEVNGLADKYEVYTHRDTLRIHPVVANEALYDYYWTAFTTTFVQNTGMVKPDTLALTKDLDYEVLLNPGAYHLVFNVREKKTGVTELLKMSMNVSTLNMNGWYLLKDDGTKTDFDFIGKEGRINDWLAFYNDGKSLEGPAVKAVFVSGFKTSLASTNLFNTFLVMSEKDAGFYRIDNGKLVKGFDDMFFMKPATRKLQNALHSMSGSNVTLINDNKAYSMTKGALFTTLPSTYKSSPVAAVAAMDIGFDLNTKSVFCFNGAFYSPLTSNGDALKNMNAELIWMNGYAGQRSVAMGLFRKSGNEGVLVKLNAQYGYLAGYQSPLIARKDTLPATHTLMSASVICGNYDADYIYYVVDNNKVYLTDATTHQETLQITLPAGEIITCMQHIKYPQPVNANIPSSTDYLAIASYINGRYKVWLHKISSTGTIQSLSQPNFEGDGRVNNVTYVELGLGSRTF